jgi:drug/metabolite transporter (DMT)-like permease
MTHRRAVLVMVVVTLLWSTAGVVTRQLEAARSFEVTFWRSLFNAAGLIVLLAWLRGPQALAERIRTGGKVLWGSGLCWSVMFTAFMVALTLTTVANVLVTMAIGPLVTALIARVFIGHRLPARTWLAIVVAGAGIVWMYAAKFASGELAGTLVALAVPLAASINWTVAQRARSHGANVDLVPAVLIGATLSSLATLPLAYPFHATGHDLGLLALLGVVQLAIPCTLAVICARVLAAPELALLGLLEVIFGIVLAWIGAGERPVPEALTGGALVIGALVANEWIGWRQRT